MADQTRRDIETLVGIYKTGVAWHCLCAIARLGVADRLADGPVPLPDLAVAVGAHEQSLGRVLRFLGDHGIVTFSGQGVGLTERGRLLCTQHPASVWSMFAASGLPDVSHALPGALRTGAVAAEQVFGTSYWQFLAANPDQQAIFDDHMRQQTGWLARNCVPALEWPAAGTVADIGGGVGVMLATILRTAPGLRGILVEQPQVLERARLYLAEQADQQVADRCELRPGDLFAPAPPADIYVLSHIIHDWADEAAIRILERVAENAPEGAMLRIFEYVIPDDDSPHFSKMSDIGMLLLFGGARERTAGEFRDLLKQTGWRAEAVTPVSGSTSLIQARRVH